MNNTNHELIVLKQLLDCSLHESNRNHTFLTKGCHFSMPRIRKKRQTFASEYYRLIL